MLSIDIPSEDFETCLDVLQRIADSRGTFRRTERLNSLIYKLYKEGRRREGKAEKRREEILADRALLATTAMVAAQRDTPAQGALPEGPAARRLHRPEYCYICKEPYHDVHFFYHFLCPKCADHNYAMRSLRADLRGRTALVTGGRVKIGFHTVLRLLRDGARVLVTTRFPQAAARRFQAESDSDEWAQRLHLYGLDLRNIPAVEAFAAHLLQSEGSVDIVIHNAAQTIRRPEGFYRELIEQEQSPLALEAQRLVVQEAPSTRLHPLPSPFQGETGVRDSSALLPAVLEGVTDVLPVEKWEDNEERADSRATNSWLLPLEEVGAQEMLEVQLVNCVAPFLLNSRLKPLLLRAPFERRFIVNVSAVEGQFSRHKTIFHPHTNMAKAALNMMTRTSAAGYAKDGIYMTSVDTGWVTDENPTPKRLRNQEELGFFAPLDSIDGMARIYHPIAAGINEAGTPFFGVFLKDYAPCRW